MKQLPEVNDSVIKNPVENDIKQDTVQKVECDTKNRGQKNKGYEI